MCHPEQSVSGARKFAQQPPARFVAVVPKPADKWHFDEVVIKIRGQLNTTSGG